MLEMSSFKWLAALNLVAGLKMAVRKKIQDTWCLIHYRFWILTLIRLLCCIVLTTRTNTTQGPVEFLLGMTEKVQWLQCCSLSASLSQSRFVQPLSHSRHPNELSSPWLMSSSPVSSARNDNFLCLCLQMSPHKRKISSLFFTLRNADC